MKKSHRTSRAVFLFCFCCDARSMQATSGDPTKENVWQHMKIMSLARCLGIACIRSVKIAVFWPPSSTYIQGYHFPPRLDYQKKGPPYYLLVVLYLVAVRGVCLRMMHQTLPARLRVSGREWAGDVKVITPAHTITKSSSNWDTVYQVFEFQSRKIGPPQQSILLSSVWSSCALFLKSHVKSRNHNVCTLVQ